MGTLEFIAALSQAFAWPIALIVAVLVLRDPIVKLIPRLRQLRVAGAEATFQIEVAASRVLATFNPDVPGDSLRDRQRRDLKDLIANDLSREERMIVVLYYYEGFTFEEIGDQLGLSAAQVRQLHSSIISKLRAGLQRRVVSADPTRS